MILPVAPLRVLDRPSPNFGARRDGALPDLVVLHFTAMTSARDALARLCDPAHQVSSHYLLDAAGQVMRLVAEEHRAWHAGPGAWGGCEDINSRSIGIELANSGTTPFSAPQMRALELLLDQVMARWNIPRHRVIGHADMAPARKTDPGPRFDRRRLALAGRSVWPAPKPAKPGPGADPAEFLRLAQRFGYPASPGFARVHAAFRARFRPWGGAVLDAMDMALIGDLADRFPVDRDETAS